MCDLKQHRQLDVKVCNIVGSIVANEGNEKK